MNQLFQPLDDSVNEGSLLTEATVAYAHSVGCRSTAKAATDVAGGDYMQVVSINQSDKDIS